MIELQGITKTFDQGAHRVEALRGIDLRIGQGEIASILGPSGSGKSTLLYVISGLQRQTHGRVVLDGRDVSTMTDNEMTLFRRDSVGMIFQSYHLFPLLTAEENVAFPGMVAGEPARKVRDRARELLGMVGLEHRLNHRPDQLSGGEQQRVAIARSLVRSPKILLADEPTGALDSHNSQEVLRLIRKVAEQFGLTVVMVTHDQSAAAIANRLVTMRDGRVEGDTGAGGVAI